MDSVYIIAEAGQNHNGSMKMAKQLIDMTAMPIIDKAFNRELKGIDAIKFTKRDMTEELTKSEYNKIYDSPNSFGKTYGEHREKLELSYEQHIELFKYAKSKGLDFVETLTSIKTLKLLEYIDVKYIKVASRDLVNIPLLDEIGKTKKPVILSTGMGGIQEIDKAIETINKYHEDIIILHCLSQYPADYNNLNLNSIPFMKERYKYTIGYSDHSIGIVAPVVAVALGAEVIEKHITLSHSLKGSDHKCALEPDGLWRMARDIRNIEIALGEETKKISEVVKPFKKKLERSLCCNKVIKKGEILKETDLIMLSPGGGLSWNEEFSILGKRALKEIEAFSVLKKEYFK
jgi:sialic acid synthase